MDPPDPPDPKEGNLIQPDSLGRNMSRLLRQNGPTIRRAFAVAGLDTSTPSNAGSNDAYATRSEETDVLETLLSDPATLGDLVLALCEHVVAKDQGAGENDLLLTRDKILQHKLELGGQLGGRAMAVGSTTAQQQRTSTRQSPEERITEGSDPPAAVSRAEDHRGASRGEDHRGASRGEDHRGEDQFANPEVLVTQHASSGESPMLVSDTGRMFDGSHAGAPPPSASVSKESTVPVSSPPSVVPPYLQHAFPYEDYPREHGTTTSLVRGGSTARPAVTRTTSSSRICLPSRFFAIHAGARKSSEEAGTVYEESSSPPPARGRELDGGVAEAPARFFPVGQLGSCGGGSGVEKVDDDGEAFLGAGRFGPSHNIPDERPPASAGRSSGATTSIWADHDAAPPRGGHNDAQRIRTSTTLQPVPSSSRFPSAPTRTTSHDVVPAPRYAGFAAATPTTQTSTSSKRSKTRYVVPSVRAAFEQRFDDTSVYNPDFFAPLPRERPRLAFYAYAKTPVRESAGGYGGWRTGGGRGGGGEAGAAAPGATGGRGTPLDGEERFDDFFAPSMGAARPRGSVGSSKGGGPFLGGRARGWSTRGVR